MTRLFIFLFATVLALVVINARWGQAHIEARTP